jgi:hypothetical protein
MEDSFALTRGGLISSQAPLCPAERPASRLSRGMIPCAYWVDNPARTTRGWTTHSPPAEQTPRLISQVA